MRYRESRFQNNMNIWRHEITTSADEIPVIRPERWVETEFVRFSDAYGIKNRTGKGVHFYQDDYKFECIWTHMQQTIAKLIDFDAIMTPDFSMYTDWPVALQKWNHYRKHYIGAYLQAVGKRVYPTIGWVDEASYEWCFEGEPVGGCVCVSSVGTQQSREAKRLFKMGFDAMMERLQPETVIFYGQVPDDCKCNIVRINPFQERLREAVISGW